MTKKRGVVGRVSKPCEVCGRAVERKASQFRDRVFCSRTCYWRSPYHREVVAAGNRTRNPVDTFRVKPCDHCGADVRRQQSQFRGRKNIFCSHKCRQGWRAANAVRQVTSSGYIKVFIGHDEPGADSKGHILEHRKVMQDHLGRALLPAENVHHKNGDRTDNRLANLELWTTSQPSGQRVADKLAWARELLALYEGTPMT